MALVLARGPGLPGGLAAERGVGRARGNMLGSSKPESFPRVVAGAGVTGEKTVGGRSRPFLAVLGGLGP